MNKSFLCILALVGATIVAEAQQQTINITQMTFGADYNVYLKMDDDSAYNYDFDKLIMADPDEVFNKKTEFIYYPVNFDQSYIDSLLNLNNQESDYTLNTASSTAPRRATLWGSVGQNIGGGWAHFINCMLFALESRQLEIADPILQRPESSWKPNPITDTWKRTHKWSFYLPVEQKYAKEEYKARKKNNKLGDVKSIPQAYIKLMLNTSQREYNKLLKNKDYKTLAKIDLVKLMLGSPYLGQQQIDYIKNRLITAISKYNRRNKPSVLIFDKYEAAVAISLDGTGYKAQKIVFRDENSLSPMQIMQRTTIIQGLIGLINVANNEAFKQKLNNLYQTTPSEKN